MIELNKMLTISTGHVCAATRARLVRNDFQDLMLPVYAKESYGWFIYLEEANPLQLRNAGLNDLADCVQFARNLGADVLCLDQDGRTVDYLPYYDEEEDPS